MYVAVAECSGNHQDVRILTPDCVTLEELRYQVDKLKDDLEWVYERMAKRRTNQQKQAD